MKCLVRKLQATINNANLPVFVDVVLKNYITTSANDQYIRFEDIWTYGGNTQMEVTYETVNLTENTCVFSILGTGYVMQNNQYCLPYNSNKGGYNEVTANTEIVAGIDTSNGGWYCGETTGTCTTPVSDTNLRNTIAIFGRGSTYTGSLAGRFKIKKVKITTHQTSSDTGVLVTLVPALVDGVACLYDENRGVCYYANTGNLIAG